MQMRNSGARQGQSGSQIRCTDPFIPPSTFSIYFCFALNTTLYTLVLEFRTQCYVMLVYC